MEPTAERSEDLGRLLFKAALDNDTGKCEDLGRLLFKAALDNDIGKLQECLAAEADVNFQHKKSLKSSLMCASSYGYTGIVEILLAHKADADARCARGGTSLMRACFKGHVAIQKLLLLHGADATLKSNEGQTAQDLAAKKQPLFKPSAMTPSQLQERQQLQTSDTRGQVGTRKLSEGMRVLIHSLENATHLNGRHGTVAKFHAEKDRWQVVLGASKSVLVRQVNLKPQSYPPYTNRKEEKPEPKSTYKDTVSKDKEDVNAEIAHLHGPPKSTHALYLDGPEMRTTRILLAAGWPSKNLHIPNPNESDHAAIQRGNTVGVNLYKQTSTELLENLVDAPWVSEFRRTHKRGPLSLVYLDYTNTKHRQADLCLLLSERLLTNGVLAITCPCLDEARNRISVGDSAGVSVEGRRAGLAKLQAELQAYAPVGTRLSCLSARIYIGVGKKTKMWVAIYRVAPDFLHDGTLSDLGDRIYDRSTPAGCKEEEIDEAAQSLHYASWKGATSTKITTLLDEVRSNAAKDESTPVVSLPVFAALERKRRELWREWDFLVLMRNAKGPGVTRIHAMDMDAFGYWLKRYNISILRFEGSTFQLDMLGEVEQIGSSQSDKMLGLGSVWDRIQTKYKDQIAKMNSQVA